MPAPRTRRAARRVKLPPDLELGRVISEEEYAELDGVSEDTVSRRRKRGEGAPRVQLSPRRFGYVLKDILAARKRKPP